MGWIKDMMTHAAQRLFKVLPAKDKAVVINEPLTFEGNALRNKLWYRGDPSELDQFFKKTATDTVGQSRFWAAVPSEKNSVRKFHSGIPSMIVDRLSDIVMADLEKIEISENKDTTTKWNEIAEDNRFDEVLSRAIAETLVGGDGAFKITLDTDLTPYPIVEYYSGDRVEYTHQRGRVREVKFKTDYSQGSKDYQLTETFGYGFIKNELRDSAGNLVDISILPETTLLQDATFSKDYMLAVPMHFFASAKWTGRGKSIFDTKSDNFDALDETISQWVDAIRSGRVVKYIPRDLLPIDPMTGEHLQPNPFDNQFIALEGSLKEDDEGKIALTQPEINYQAYCETYANNLDMCLQGIISPSTLGIDLKKTDNATAQREKEKTTLYTRGKIVDVLEKVIPEVVNTMLMADATLKGKTVNPEDVTITFGEYAAPDFDSTVETVGKAKSYGIMSVEQCVEKLYGDTLNDDEKQEEIERLKEEQGFNGVEEPAVAGEDGFDQEEPDPDLVE